MVINWVDFLIELVWKWISSWYMFCIKIFCVLFIVNDICFVFKFYFSIILYIDILIGVWLVEMENLMIIWNCIFSFFFKVDDYVIINKFLWSKFVYVESWLLIVVWFLFVGS